MKRLLFSIVLGSALIFPPVYALDSVEKTLLGVIATGAGIATTYYVVNKFPSRQYASAKKTYTNLEEHLASLLEDFCPCEGDITEFSIKLYPCSAYPLVLIFNLLNSAHADAKGALQKIENALWWSKDEAFGSACHQLKEQFEERIALYEELIALTRSNSGWIVQYSHYLQKCANDDLQFMVLNGVNHRYS